MVYIALCKHFFKCKDIENRELGLVWFLFLKTVLCSKKQGEQEKP